MGIIVGGIILSILVVGIFSSNNPARMSAKEEEDLELLKYDPITDSYKK